MVLDSFDALLRAAREQPEGQRLLFVFVKAVLPDEASAVQAERFQAGQGGALEPVMYVDKGRHEVANFDSLIAESLQTGKILGRDDIAGDWDLVIVGCLAGYGERDPTPEEAEQPLNDLLRSIRTGRSLIHLAAFDRQGHPVRFQ